MQIALFVSIDNRDYLLIQKEQLTKLSGNLISKTSNLERCAVCMKHRLVKYSLLYNLQDNIV